MSGWWTPIWSVGTGASRIYCGIARTEEGFAVDVFRADTCIESMVYESRREAVRGAAAFERQYVHRAPRQSRRDADTHGVAAHG